MISDSGGLSRAYAAPHSVYAAGPTLFVAGTHTLGDVINDTAIPLGLTRHTMRYHEAREALRRNPSIKRLVGHSLGGSVVLEVQKRHPGCYETTTYGAPVVSWTPGDRHRSLFDPISMFDRGASISMPGLNPHSYASLGKSRVTTQFVLQE
jgi:pimeloyl-ACP methyl ester carboxylesterase